MNIYMFLSVANISRKFVINSFCLQVQILWHYFDYLLCLQCMTFDTHTHMYVTICVIYMQSLSMQDNTIIQHDNVMQSIISIGTLLQNTPDLPITFYCRYYKSIILYSIIYHNLISYYCLFCGENVCKTWRKDKVGIHRVLKDHRVLNSCPVILCVNSIV